MGNPNKGINSSNMSDIVKIGSLYIQSAKKVEDNYEDKIRTGDDKVNITLYKVTDAHEFLDVLKETWNKLPEKHRWKVDSPANDPDNPEKAIQSWIDDHPDVEMYVTPNGSTVAINKGDIISVSSPRGLGEGLTIMQYAIDHGGQKLDSYESNYGFYRKLGFKTVSYTPFKKGVNPHWKNGRDKSEDIIFMALGGTNGKGAKGDYNKSREEYNNELKTKVKPNLYKGEDTPDSDKWEDSGYYKAQKVRDNYMEYHKKRYSHK